MISCLVGEPIGLTVSQVARLTDRQITEIYRRAVDRINGVEPATQEPLPEPQTPEEEEAALRWLMGLLGATEEQIEAEVKRQIKRE